MAHLFSSTQFYLTGEPQPHTVTLLVEGGGRSLSYLSGLTTHCIAANQPDYQEMAEAEELLEVPVVTEEWVIASARCGQLLPVRGFSTSASQLFSGVTLVLDSDSLGHGDCEKIWAMVTWYGGRVGKMEEGGTHFVTGVHDGKQMEMMVVTPDWVVESVRDGVRGNEEEYHPFLLVKANTKFEEDSVQKASADEDIIYSNTAEQEAEEKISTSLVEEVEVSVSNTSCLKPEVTSAHANQFSPKKLLLINSVLATHQEDIIESSQSSSFGSASTSFHEEDEDTPSDYFSQGMESAEEEESSTEKRKSIKDDLNCSIEDVVAETPVKKRRVSVESSDTSRWSKTEKFRTSYTRAEGTALVNFFMKQGVYFMRGGNQIWKVVEKAWICPGRSWQSLKHFFLKYLVKQLPSYGVTEEELEAEARSKYWVGEELSEVVASYYTMAEDRKILNYIIDYGRVERTSAGGDTFWKMMEKKTVVVGRSWQSMNERFRKRISTNLKSYNLSDKDLEDVVAWMQLHNVL